MNNNSLGGQLQGQPTTEQQQLNEKLQYIACYGEQAYNQREQNKLSREKIERLRDEFAMAVITGIYSNPDRKGTALDALKSAYELANCVPIAREIK